MPVAVRRMQVSICFMVIAECPERTANVVSVARLNARYAQHRCVTRADVARDDRLERCRNVTSCQYGIDAFLRTGTVRAFARDSDVKEGPASHHRPWANSELSNRQVGSIVHAENAVTREALE